MDTLLTDKEVLAKDVILNDNLGHGYHERTEVEVPSTLERRGKLGSCLLLSLTSVSSKLTEQILLETTSRHMEAYNAVCHSIFLGTQ